MLKHVPEYMPKDVLRHMPDKHVLEHVPGHVSRLMPKHMVKRMVHTVLMT